MRSNAALMLRSGTAPQPVLAPSGPAAYGPYWAKAEWIVLGMMAVVAVRIHEFFPGLGVVKPVFSLTIVGTYLLLTRSAARVRANLTSQRLSLLVYLYFGAICLTIPFALWHGAASGTAQSMVPAILLYAAFQFVPPERAVLDRLQFGFIVLVLFFSWYLQTFGRIWGGRLVSVSGTFDSNDVASVLSMSLPMAIAVFMRVRGVTKKAWSGIAIFAIVAGVISTGSRGGTLALVAGALVFVSGLNSTKAVLTVYFMAMAAGAFWVTAPGSFRNRVRSLSNLDNDYNTTAETGRKAVWRRGRQYIRDNPLVGVGAGNFFMAEANYNEATGITGKWSAAHNAYIQALAELGIPGGSVFIFMLLTAAGMALSFWRRSFYSRGPPFHRPELLAALVAFAVGATFLSHAYFTPLYAVLGLVSLAARIRIAERTGVPASAMPAPVAVPTTVPGQRGGLARGGSARSAHLREGKTRASRGDLGAVRP